MDLCLHYSEFPDLANLPAAEVAVAEKKTILEKHSQFKLNLFKKRNIISGQANPLQWQMYKYTVFGWKTFIMRKHFACPKYSGF